MPAIQLNRSVGYVTSRESVSYGSSRCPIKNDGLIVGNRHPDILASPHSDSGVTFFLLWVLGWVRATGFCRRRVSSTTRVPKTVINCPHRLHLCERLPGHNPSGTAACLSLHLFFPDACPSLPGEAGWCRIRPRALK